LIFPMITKFFKRNPPTLPEAIWLAVIGVVVFETFFWEGGGGSALTVYKYIVHIFIY
jgi:hypothetical protein